MKRSFSKTLSRVLLAVFLTASGSLYGINAPTNTTVSNQSKGVVTVSWNVVSDAIGYHLEWIYVNSYGGKQLPNEKEKKEKFFREGATRIESTGLTYNIPAIYENGYLLIRIRAFKKSNDGKIIVSDWSEPQSTSVSSDTKDKMNWQAIVNYAEEGKNKEVVTYYDGTSRARQSVTRNSSNNDIIVGETYYDHQGRPSVTALPVPSMEDNDYIRYHYDFNKVESSGEVYDRKAFDVDMDSCNVVTNKMSTTSGSAKYYSSANTKQDGYNQYIPDAFGYPFSQTEYTPDNTGRIRRQGGVGPQYQLSETENNSTVHPTTYFYGKPTQEDLWRLFGSQCGDFSHYQKNMVKDPNGSIQVSYVDMHGRTIATAMAGNNPTSFSALDSKKMIEKKVNLVDYPSVPQGEIAYLSTFDFLVSTEGDYYFNYKMNVKPVKAQEFCMQCNYKLRLEVRNDCGSLIQNMNVVSIKPEQLKNNVGDTSLITISMTGKDVKQCDSEEQYDIAFTLNLPVGNYHITRFIEVDQDVQRTEIDRYLASENVKTLYDFVEEEIAATDFSQCNVPSCYETCMKENPTSYADYIDCVAECMDEDTVNSCTSVTKRMIDDFVPGTIVDPNMAFESNEPDLIAASSEQVAGGQYAVYKINENGEYISVNNSIFNDDIFNEIMNDGNFKKVVEKNDIIWDSIFVKDDINENKKAFISNFDRSWAEYLAPKYHPEWPLKADCEATRLMQLYEIKMRLVDNYEDAYALRFFNPLSSNGDLYFKKSTQLDNAMKQYYSGTDKKGNQVNLSIWQSALSMALSEKYKDFDIKNTAIEYPASVYSNGCPKNIIIGGQVYNVNWDLVWQYYRSLYLSKRRSIFNKNQKNGKSINTKLIGNGVTLSKIFKESRIPDLEESTEMEKDSVMTIIGNNEQQVQKDINKKILLSCLNQAKAQISTIFNDLRYCFKDSIFSKDSTKLAENFIKVLAFSAYKSGNILGYSSIPEDSCCPILRPNDPDTLINFIPARGQNSFEKILNEQYPNLLSEECNSYLITSIVEYGNDNLYTTEKPLDACGCQLITQMAEEFNQQDKLPVNIHSAQAYFEDKTGVAIDNFNAKLCACRNAQSWTSEEGAQALKKTGYTIPIDIVCDECIPCDTVVNAMNKCLRLLHVIDETNVVFGSTLSYLAKKSLTNYLNQKFNMSKTFEEYMEFANKCHKADTNFSETECTETVAVPQLIHLLNELKKEHRLVDTINDSRLYFDIQKMIRVSDKNITGFNSSDMPTANPYGYDITNESTKVSTERECTGDCAYILFEVEDTITGRTNMNIIDGNESYDIQLQSVDSVLVKDIVWINSSYLKDSSLYLVATVIDDNKFREDTFAVSSSEWRFSSCSTIENKDDLTLCKKRQVIPTEVVNECEERLHNQIYYNAKSLYEDYIDTLRATISDEYVTKCLNNTKQEDYAVSYNDSEHHYTLFYYDQAGNLVRTVPPAGVEFVDVDNADVRQRLEADLANGTQNVFTKHRLETRYVYNSLNQLVYQYMPDHDGFADISSNDKSLTSTTDVNTSSYVGSVGVSVVQDPNETDKSIIYVSEDNGNNWISVDKDIEKKNIYAIHVMSNGTQYVAGENGLLLEKEPNSSSWTAVHTNHTDDIIRVGGYNSTNLRLYTTNGSVYTRSSERWNKSSSQTGTLHAISSDAKLAVGDQNGKGVIYTGNNTSWTPFDMSKVKTDDIVSLAMNSDEGYAIDKAGVILHTVNGGSTWSYVGSTSTPYKDMCYVNNQCIVLTENGDVVDMNRPSSVNYSNVSAITACDNKLFYIRNGVLFSATSSIISENLNNVQDFVILSKNGSSPKYVVYYVTNDGSLHERKINERINSVSHIKSYYTDSDGIIKNGCKGLALLNNEVYTCCANKIIDVTGTNSFEYNVTQSPNLWDLNSKGFVITSGNQISTLQSKASSIEAATITLPTLNAVSVFGSQAVVAGNEGVVLYSDDLSSFKLLPTNTNDNLLCASIYVPSSNGKRVAVGGQNGTALLITGETIQSFNSGTDNNISAVCIYRNSLFFGTEDGKVGYWDLSNHINNGWGDVPSNVKVNVIFANDTKVWFGGDNAMIYDGSYQR